MSISVQSLNGLWDYKIADGEVCKKEVPFSDFPVGFSTCSLNFKRNGHGKRAFLVFDGITYSADVYFNGESLGTMLPYSEYRYEITDLLKDEDNLVSVTIRDVNVVFGPAEGWANYSGIIRDVYIEYSGDEIIKDTFWKTAFKDDYKKADCTVSISTDGKSANSAISVELTDKDGAVIYKNLLPSEKDMDINFAVSNPHLWCPDDPYLYTLKITLLKDGEVSYECVQKVGFKEFSAKGKRFYLNGEPTFLIGVCRHDLYGESGHIMTEKQMRDDMQMIKDAGCNYVRLVHYPHHKDILSLADELGLLVSEEPGLWWSDVSNEEIFNGSLEVLRRVIIRDRNHASIAFWLSFNECRFTPEYLVAAAKVARDNDPTHMISGANCMDIPMTKKHFVECGLDFYTMHPYSSYTGLMVDSAKQLTEKPLMLTEWGGHFLYNNPNLMKVFVETMIKLWNNPESEPVITGASIWCWAEVYEFNRGEPACHGGVLNEGLVDSFRNPKITLEAFKTAFAELKNPTPKEKFTFVEDIHIENENIVPVELSYSSSQNEAWDTMMKHALTPIATMVMPERNQRILIDGPCLNKEIDKIGNLSVKLLKKPLVISEVAPFETGLPENSTGFYIIGNVSMPKGFPIDGVYDEAVATLEVTYKDNNTEEIVLRNGKEITTATAWYGPSRINPRAKNAPRALRFINNMDREHYIANCYKLKRDKEITTVKIHSVKEGYDLLLYGISAIC